MLEQDGSVSGLYDAWSESYDEDLNRTRDLAGRVLRRARLRSLGTDAVELGCGTGANTAWLAERARSVIAIDFSEGMLRRAREKVTVATVSFLHHDVLLPWPLPDASADLVVIILVLEHVPLAAPIFEETARILRPGGELFLCEYHPFRQLGGSQARFQPAGSDRVVRIPAYLHMMEEFVNAGVDAGLTVAGMEERGDEEHPEPNATPRVVAITYRK